MEKCLFFIRLLVVLWVMSAVAESHVEKRAVHRIILKTARKPRSHHRPYHHHKHYDHSRENYGRSKRNKYREQSYEEPEYYSRENTYEEYPRHHQKRPRPTRTPNYSSSVEYEDSKPEFKSEWTPVLSSENTLLHQNHRYEDHHHHSKKKQYKSHHKKHQSPLHIELTTRYPPKKKHVPFFSEDFPASIQHYNQKTIDAKHSSLVADGIYNRAPRQVVHHKNSSDYEVHEKQKDLVSKEQDLTHSQIFTSPEMKKEEIRASGGKNSARTRTKAKKKQ